MTEQLTIGKLATKLKRDPEELLRIMQKSGLPHKSLEDTLTSSDQMKVVKAIAPKNKNETVVRNKSSTMYSKSGSSVRVDVSERVFVEAETKEYTDFPPNEEKSEKAKDNKQTQATTKEIDAKPDATGKPIKAQEKGKATSKDSDSKVKPSVKEPTKLAEFEEEKPKKKSGPKKAKLKHDDVDKSVKDISKLLSNVYDDEGVVEVALTQKPVATRSNNKVRSKKKIKIENKHAFVKPTVPITHTIEIGQSISVDTLAKGLSVKTKRVLSQLTKLGIAASINQDIDQETAVLVTEELGHKAIALEIKDAEESLFAKQDLAGNIEVKPPVVAIMGHVDHGKTSLLDYIRKTKIVDGESGGITQHIGAYRAKTKNSTITFLDTPGHAAFTAMRSRGAEITDIVVLIIAADDGIMPQTVEAIEHAKASNATIIVAITKIDKVSPDLEKIKSELSTHHLVAEDWGGDLAIVQVSSHTGEGIDELLESILLHAEVMELKTSLSQSPRGYIIEARLDKHRGSIAHLLVTNGVLKVGDFVLAGTAIGKIRSMIDEHGKQVKTALPSTPVEILGLNKVPEAGDQFTLVIDEKQAQQYIMEREIRDAQPATPSVVNLQSMLAMSNDDKTMLTFIIRADVKGTLEAIVSTLGGLTKDNDSVDIKIVSAATGSITETDIMLASASSAIVIGFHVRADTKARNASDAAGVEIRYYSIIYNLIEDIENLISGATKKEKQEIILGLAEVRDVFSSPKFGQVAGCFVTEGHVVRHKPIRVLREERVIFTGELSSLRRFSTDMDEVKHGSECGMGIKNYKDIKVGDQIEVYDID